MDSTALNAIASGPSPGPIQEQPAGQMVAGVVWQFASDASYRLRGETSLPLTTWLRDGAARVVKESLHRTVYRIDLPTGALYVKHDRCRDWRRLARHAVRASAARREWRITLEVARRGIATVRPVALGEQFRGPLVADSYFVSAEVPDSCPLDHYLNDVLPGLPPRSAARTRRALIEALARFTAAAHSAGVDHRDFHAGNLLLQWDAAPANGPRPRLTLIDLASVRLTGPLGWRRTRDSLAMLHTSLLRQATRGDRWRFWRAYLVARPDMWMSEPRLAAGQIAERARAHARHIFRGRDERCLRNNRDFLALKTSTGTAHAVRSISIESVEELLADPASPLRAYRHQPHKLSHSSVVVEANLPQVNLDIRVAYKRSRIKRWWKLPIGLWRAGRARRCWQMGHALVQRGIATPLPLAVIVPRTGRWRGEGFLATEWIAGASDLHLYAWKLAAGSGPERTRRVRQAAGNLGRLIGQMHGWRISHRDLKGCNLVLAEHEDRVAAWLIDLDGVRIVHWLTAARRAGDLSRLAVSVLAHHWLTRTDRLRFLRAYLRAFPDGGNWKGLWRAIDQRAKKLAIRIRDRGEPLA